MRHIGDIILVEQPATNSGIFVFGYAFVIKNILQTPIPSS